jgi:hypothetical protein
MSQFPRSACLSLKKNIDHWTVLAVLLALPLFSGLATAGEVTVDPTSVDFGTVTVGSHPSVPVTVTNTGGSTIKVSNVAVYGTGFSLQGLTTPLVLSAGESSTFSVVFDPQTAVSAKGGLVVISDTPDSPHRVRLTGTGWVPVNSVVPPQNFGFNLHPKAFQDTVPWPSIHFGSLRLWATQTTWNDLNPSSGVYDFQMLDSTIAVAAQNGKTDLLYTFGVTPHWASSKPNDQICVSKYSPPGSCDAPYDLNADGTGTDMIWQEFVTAVVTHAAGKIHYWEVWNEPDVPMEWNGTMAQMARMAKDAYTIIKAIDPSALVTTPTPVNAAPGQSINIWLPKYLGTGGAAYADIVSFHGYVNPSLPGQSAESEVNVVNGIKGMVAGTALASKPIWDTEGAWGNNTNLPEPELQAAFLARVYLLQWSLGVSRFYWFQYGNSDTGTTWTPAGPNAAEIGYGQVYDWIVGATLTGPCSAAGSVWTCNFTKPGGVKAQAVWDSSKTCKSDNCTTSTYTPSSIYTKYTDLTGSVVSFAPGATIQIGAKPVLLENQ